MSYPATYFAAKRKQANLSYLKAIAYGAGETRQVTEYQAQIDALQVEIAAMELEAQSDVIHLAELKK